MMMSRKYAVPLLAVAMLGSATALALSLSDHSEVLAQTPEVKHANDLSTAFRAASKEVLPAVVKITATTQPRQMSMPRGGQMQGGELQGNPFEGSPFEEFFKQRGMDEMFRMGPQGLGGRQQQRPSQGVGSGVVIGSDGLILTNNHVVGSADDVQVELADGRIFEAVKIKTDPQTDLALVWINAKDLPAAKLGNSDALEIGDWVIAIGHPFRLDATVSAGIISGKSRALASAERAEFLQTDAAINPGNSGGPLVNLYGEVIGINTAIATQTGTYNGIGYAVPSNLAKWITKQLQENGVVQRAYLGVGIAPLDAALASKFGVDMHSGVIVNEVRSGSPAQKAGLQSGDVIVNFDGHDVGSPRDLQAVVERTPMDRARPMTIVRNGSEMNVNVKLEQLTEQVLAADDQTQPLQQQGETEMSNDVLGFSVSDLSPEAASRFGYADAAGVIVNNVEMSSDAWQQGIRQGMLIESVERQSVSSVEEFNAAVAATKDQGVLLHVRTPETSRWIVVEKQ